MDLFGKEAAKKISAIEREIVRLKKSDVIKDELIASLRISVSESLKKSPEYEKEARQSSKRASECKNRAVETLQAISQLLDDISKQKQEIATIKLESEGLNNDIKTHLETIIESENEINLKKEDIFESIDGIRNKLDEIIEAYEEYPDLSASLDELNDFVSKVEENSNKSGQLLKSISTRKIEIDNIHREIYGFEQRNDENEELIHVAGLKDQLDGTYSKLEKQANELSKAVSDIKNEASSKFSVFVESSEKTNLNLAADWEKKHEEINKKIKNLLPNALTAGLSYAFSEKKKDEDSAYENHKTQFRQGILGLIVVSAIPFAISILFLINGKRWDEVINHIPRIVLAIVPLYLPVLWLAFSSSKKMNLSKRLIEEYSHKEVLSKTFEGLSSQINDLDDNTISSELRVKLLQNFLQVYSENPGKLISNYETSDHPIMEVLEQSYKLESTVEKLRKVPGLDKISKIIESKSDKILRETDEVVEEGFKTMKKLDDDLNQ